jgi:hypothetical protein
VRRHGAAINAEHEGTGQSSTTNATLPTNLGSRTRSSEPDVPGPWESRALTSGELLERDGLVRFAGYQTGQDWNSRALTWQASPENPASSSGVLPDLKAIGFPGLLP